MTALSAWPRVTSITPAAAAFVVDVNPDTTPVTKSILASNVAKSLFASVTDPVLFKSNDGINFDTADGGDGDLDVLTLDVTGTPKLWWDESADAFVLSKALAIGATDTNSPDYMVNVSRAVEGDGAVLGNGHCFSDSSVITRTGTIAYNSYDGRITVSGTADYNHFASFQAASTYGTSGTIGKLYGFIDAPIVSAGTVTDRYGVHIDEVTGDGAVTNNYGIYVEELTKGGTLDYAIRTVGATMSYLGGNLGIGIAPNAYTAIYIGGATAETTHYGIMNYISNAGSQVGFDARGTTTGAGNLSLIVGIYSRMTHDSNGTLANYYGSYTLITNNGGNCVNAYGHYVAAAAGTGTITNVYGVYVAEQTKGGTLNYAIYTAGDTPSLFGGPVTVGGLTMEDGTNIVLNATTGTKIGTANTQKLGFYNATPIVQPVVAAEATVATLITALTNLGLIRNS